MEVGNRGSAAEASSHRASVADLGRQMDGFFSQTSGRKTPSVTFCRRVVPGRTTSAGRDASEDVERTLSSSMSIATEKRSSLLSDAMVPQRRTRGASFSDGGPGGDRSRPFEVANRKTFVETFRISICISYLVGHSLHDHDSRSSGWKTWPTTSSLAQPPGRFTWP